MGKCLSKNKKSIDLQTTSDESTPTLILEQYQNNPDTPPAEASPEKLWNILREMGMARTKDEESIDTHNKFSEVTQQVGAIGKSQDQDNQEYQP